MEICNMCIGKKLNLSSNNENIIFSSCFFYITINPRWSPHLGRVAIVPLRHIGKDGLYGMEALTDEERVDFINLRILMTKTIIDVFSNFGIGMRDGCHDIETICRPSQHPSLDIFPIYIKAPIYKGWQFPHYVESKISKGSAPSEIEVKQTLLASFSDPGLLMPLELRLSLVNDLKNNFLNRD